MIEIEPCRAAFGQELMDTDNTSKNDGYERVIASTGDLFFFRKLFDQMPQLGWTALPDGYIDWYNRRWFEYSGTTMEQMEGWGWESIHDPALLPEVKERWSESIRTGKPFEMKFPLRDKDGNFQWFLTRINPIFDESGNIVRWVAINTNIQKEIEQAAALAATAAQLETITENATVALFFMDRNGLCTFANSAALAMTGYSLYELQGQTLHEKIHRLRPDGSVFPQSECLVDRALPERNQIRNHEDRLLRKDDSFVDVIINAQPIEVEGVPIGTVIEVRDVSDENKLRAELRERTERLSASEKHFRELADSMPSFVWASDPDGYTYFHNKTFWQYAGHPPEAVRGWGWLEIVHPDDRAGTIERWEKARQTGTHYRHEFRLRSANGEYRWFSVNGLPVRDEAGSVTDWFGNCTDIQESKLHATILEKKVAERTRELAEAKALIELVLESISDAILVSDETGELTYMNKAARELHGTPRRARSMEELPRIFELFELDAETYLSVEKLPLVRALAGEKVDDQEIIIKSYDGSRTLVASVFARPFKDTDGKMRGAVLAVRDITLRKQAELEIGKARDEAIAASEAKSRFLATVSHEVRTPMSAIIGLVELLLAHSADKDSEAHALARAALDSSKRLVQILNDLLDASKLQAHAVSLENRWFSLKPIVGDIVQLIAREAQSKGVKLISNVSRELPEQVCGDELRVRQIFQNLIFNALKFTEQGSITITLEETVKSSPGRREIRFAVTDTGIGIPAEQQSTIFEPFVQAEPATSRVYGGTGLGLSICKTLVELMGGTIAVESTPGKGSTFTVLLPFEDLSCSNQ